MAITVLAALATAACFAVGAVLQQREASGRPASESLSPRLLLALARNRVWVAGILTMAVSYVFKALALAFGPLAVVQPLIASELVFAIPPSVRRHGERLGAREWTGILAIAAGLTIGIVAASPEEGDPLPPPGRWAAALAALAALTVAALLVGRRIEGPSRAAFFALAAVALLAAQSALLAATVALFQRGLSAVLTAWQPYLLAALSIVALIVTESAYQAGPLAASMPVMDAANPVLTAAVGVTVFGESIATGVWNLLGTALGLTLLVGGVILVDTSPLVCRVQRLEAARRTPGARP